MYCVPAGALPCMGLSDVWGLLKSGSGQTLDKNPLVPSPSSCLAANVVELSRSLAQHEKEMSGIEKALNML